MTCEHSACNGDSRLKWADGSVFNEYGTVFAEAWVNDLNVLDSFATNRVGFTYSIKLENDFFNNEVRVVCQVDCLPT